MLVLTRKPKESVTIGNEIRVTLLEIRGNQVRLGIEAPRDTPVNRTEVYEMIVQENVQASKAPLNLDQLLPALKGEG
ncbi:MAG: carbon storage regulator CsrA [Deltaproteobacteria bacterium]|nr:carbon storage regulator CsrA [Deltaproteobacteria bacterium]